MWNVLLFNKLVDSTDAIKLNASFQSALTYLIRWWVRRQSSAWEWGPNTASISIWACAIHFFHEQPRSHRRDASQLSWDFSNVELEKLIWEDMDSDAEAARYSKFPAPGPIAATVAKQQKRTSTRNSLSTAIQNIHGAWGYIALHYHKYQLLHALDYFEGTCRIWRPWAGSMRLHMT